MNKQKIINEINEIIGKIDKKFSEELKGRDIDKFLEEINADLVYLVENSEEEHKQMISKKVELFQATINKNIEDRLTWTEVQNSLGEIKNGLNGLTNDISKENEELKELAEWRKFFPGQNAKSVFTQLQKVQTENSSNSSVSGINDGVIDAFTHKISGLQIRINDGDTKIEEFKEELETKNQEIFELKNRDNSDGNINEQADKIREYGVIAVKTGVEEGSKVFPVVGPAVGGLLGAGIGGIGAFTHTALYATRRIGEIHNRHLDIVEDGMQKIYDAKSDIKEVALGITEAGAGIEMSGMNIGQGTTKIGLNAEKFSVGVGMGNKKTFEEKLKAKDREIEILEQRIEELKKQIESERQQSNQGNQNLIQMAQMFAPNK